VATVNWNTIGTIVAGWVISPLMGGLVAAAFLLCTKRAITYRQDMVSAACRHLPLLMAVMAWLFSTYLLTKGLAHLWPMGFATAAALGLGCAVLVYWGHKRRMARLADTLDNNKASINRLFALPL